MGEAVDVAADKLHLARGDLLNLVLGPLQEVRGRAAKLPRESMRCTRPCRPWRTMLDALLDAPDPQPGWDGSPAARSMIVSSAVRGASASSRCRRLNADLTRTRADIAATRGYLDGVGRMIADNVVSEATARSLQAEFRLAHRDRRARPCTALEQRAQFWQEEGAPLIGAGPAWAEREFEVANVRQAVGQWTPPDAEARRQYVHRHRQAMTEALTLIGGLDAGGDGNVRTIPAAV